MESLAQERVRSLLLAQQVVAELQLHRKLTMQTLLRLHTLEQQERELLSNYLPPLEGLELNDFTLLVLFAGVGFVENMKSTHVSYHLEPSVVRAAIKGDQVEVLEYILRMGTYETYNLACNLALEMNRPRCILLILRRRPYSMQFLIAKTLANQDVTMLRLLMENLSPEDQPLLNFYLSLAVKAENQNPEIVQVLLDAGANDLDDALVGAFVSGCRPVIALLIQKGAKPMRALTDKRCMDPWILGLILEYFPQADLNPSLRMAATNGDLVMVKTLLDRGANDTQGAMQALYGAEHHWFVEIMIKRELLHT